MTNEQAKSELMQIYMSLSEEKKQALDVLMAQADGEKSFKMRDATPEEREAVDKYIKSISKPTGVNVFDFYEDEEQEQIDFVQPKKKIPCTIKVQADGEYIPKQAVLENIDQWYEDKADIEDLIVKITYMPSVAIPSADMFSDLKAEISVYENGEQSIDEMLQGIKSIISIYER